MQLPQLFYKSRYKSVIERRLPLLSAPRNNILKERLTAISDQKLPFTPSNTQKKEPLGGSQEFNREASIGKAESHRE
jgi:hypothetical protein